ncbi:MAG: hypothetical protein JKX69_03670 [Rhodobacteraceae bacterium]|nr:hypothetical protein [Paracoccaceae bacterium]
MLKALDILPEDPTELRAVSKVLAAEVKSQALLIHYPTVDCVAINERGEVEAPACGPQLAPTA